MSKSTIYGPVASWRFGESLGVDLLFQSSICSFNCIYCQLGEIQKITTKEDNYIETKKVIHDFEEFLTAAPKRHYDVITFSGNGEPTLAKNIDEIIEYFKSKTNTPILILTNGTQLHSPEVRKKILKADRLIVKLDAFSEDIFQKMNRPAPGVTLKKIIEGTLELKKEFKGEIDLQVMIMPLNLKEINLLVETIKLISPDVVQLNTPKRPYPTEWDIENRGNHDQRTKASYRPLRVISKDEAKEIEQFLKQELPHIEFTSVYRD